MEHGSWRRRGEFVMPVGIKACIFDAYGTLFDVNAAARGLASEIGPGWAAFSETWRAKQLSYSWLRTIAGDHADFWQVTIDALDFALEQHRIAKDGRLRDNLLQLYFNLACFPEAPALLKALKAAGMITGILSNGSPGMLEAACKSAGVAPLLDHVISVEEIGRFKPTPDVYRLVTQRLGLEPSEIAFHSSNGWDAHAGRRAGFYSIWINRTGQPAERMPHKPDREIATLEDVPMLLGIRPA